MTTTERDRATVAWIRSRLSLSRHLGAPPRFGSFEWHRLPDDDPRKYAAVLIAAACYWDDGRPDRIRERLADEIAVARQVEADREAAEFAAVADRIRRHANSPTHAEVVRRWAS